MRSLPDLDRLSLAEQVAQMLVIRASGYLFDRQILYPAWKPPAVKLQHLVELGVGSAILGRKCGRNCLTHATTTSLGKNSTVDCRRY